MISFLIAIILPYKSLLSIFVSDPASLTYQVLFRYKQTQNEKKEAECFYLQSHVLLQAFKKGYILTILMIFSSMHIQENQTFNCHNLCDILSGFIIRKKPLSRLQTGDVLDSLRRAMLADEVLNLSLIHISEPTRQ